MQEKFNLSYFVQRNYKRKQRSGRAVHIDCVFPVFISDMKLTENVALRIDVSFLQISREISQATCSLVSRLETRKTRLESLETRLETRSSKFSRIENRVSRLEDRDARDCLLTFERYCISS